MIDLGGLNRADQLNQTGRIGHVAVVKVEGGVRVMGDRIRVQVLDTRSVEGRRPTNDAVHFVALAQQQFGQVRSVLSNSSVTSCWKAVPVQKCR